MQNSSFTILPLAVLNIILETAKSMHKNDLIFSDQLFTFPITNFKQLVIEAKIRRLGIFDLENLENVGVLSFENNNCFTINGPIKIIWKIKLEKYNQEQRAITVVEIIKSINPKIRTQVIVEGNK
ncbi:MAG: hypothetical protein PF572_00400 [Patescibacteria group bacterium]|jgi:hypothetical protein|nr:hypothetical protein [Patescibacteria group bacterium]